ncbi:MAG: winged helix-turn-helix domain-containing protein [Blastocatellia bacterium]
MTDEHDTLFEFGPFSLNPREPALLHEGRPQPLPPKVFELLRLLLENSGQILEKDHLLEQLWPDAIVEESSLTQLVFQLRKALGESGARQQYIETVPRRGYRFIAEVRLTQRGESEITLTSRTGTRIVIEEEEVRNPVTAPVISPAPSVMAQPGASRAPWKKSKTWWALAALLLVAAIAGSWPWFKGRNRPAAFTQFNQRKLTASGKAFHPAVSANGKWVAYVFEDAGKHGVWVRQAETTDRIQIVPASEQDILGVTFSPDGQFVYYVVRPKNEAVATLHQISTIGGAARKVLSNLDTAVTFAPEGKRFAFLRNVPETSETILLTANADGTQEQPLAVRKRPNSFLPQGPAWSPDGRTIACSMRQVNEKESYAYIATVSVADGQVTPLGASRWTMTGQTAWLNDGSGLVVTAWHQASPVFADQLWLLSWPEGEARQITNDLNSREGVSLAAQANVLATARADRIARMWVLPGGKTGAAQVSKAALADNYSEIFGLDWTPDGKLVYGTHAGGNADIAVMEADGTKQRQLTFDARRETWPVVSADGQFIVFTAQGADPPHLWRMKRDGGDRRQLTYGRGESYPSLTPDGRWAIYSSVETGESNLWKVSLDGGQPVRLTSKPSGRATVSPDGQWIACLYRDDKQKPVQVVLLPVAGGEPVKVFDKMPPPGWSVIKWTPDGRALTYIATRDGVSNLWAQPIDGGAPRQLTQFREDQIFRFAWSRDGKQLALDRGLTLRDIILLSDFR